MNRKIYIVVLITFFIFSFSDVFSQVETDTLKQATTVVIRMKNGEEFKGQIVQKDSNIIVIETVNGKIKLIASKVVSIEDYTYEGKFEFANPHDTRYFFGPSGIPLKEGKWYYQNILVTTNFVNYGISKNISIGGGIEFMSTIMGEPIWFLTPKVGFDITKNIHIGGGIIMVGFTFEGFAGLGYGVFTLGNSETNLSIGLGYGGIGDEFISQPTIMFSATHRVSKSIALLTENYIIPLNGENLYFGVHGLRILSKKNAFDIGVLVIPKYASVIAAIPYIGYVRVF